MWNQAFKWVNQYISQDQGHHEVKPMSKEEFEWLEKAFESISVNETKEIIFRLDKLKGKPESKNEEDLKFRVDILEDILSYIDGLEVARNVVRCKRFEEIVNMFFNTVHFNLKLQLARLLSSMMQNDKTVQLEALKYGILNCLLYLKSNELYSITDKDNLPLVNKSLLIVSGIVNGDCIESKKAFVDAKGLEVLFDLYKAIPSIRILRIIEEIAKPEIDKTFLENSKYMIDYFLQINGVDYIINLYDSINKEDSNEDNEEIKSILMNILSHTSHQWNETNYSKFSSFINTLFKDTTDIKKKKQLLSDVKKINSHYNNKAQDFTEITAPFEFTEMSDGGKVITLDHENTKAKENKILSIGN